MVNENLKLVNVFKIKLFLTDLKARSVLELGLRSSSTIFFKCRYLLIIINFL